MTDYFTILQTDRFTVKGFITYVMEDKLERHSRRGEEFYNQSKQPNAPIFSSKHRTNNEQKF